MSNKKHIIEIKKQITDFLITHKEDDTIEVADVFKHVGGRNFQLTHYGLRNLSDYYVFYEIEFEFNPTIINYSALDSFINGMYYLKPEEKKSLITVHTTDNRFMNLVKIHKWKFDILVDSYNNKRNNT